MAFSIAFQKEPQGYPYEDRTTPAASGLLLLGDVRESFLSSLHQWSREDYERQWKDAIELLLRGKDKSALITTYGSPEVATHLEWWPMYMVGNKVFFQDHLLFYDQLPEPFCVDKVLSYLHDRRVRNSEGKKISEWWVDLSDVEIFARSLSRERR
jgi:hypothetical protein